MNSYKPNTMKPSQIINKKMMETLSAEPDANDVRRIEVAMHATWEYLDEQEPNTLSK